MDKHTCRNCDNHFSGAYCNKCGQKLAHRITMGHIAHDITHAFTHADKGFFHLMLGLFKNPGKVAREYIIEEKRKRYFTPFQYVLIIGTIATFVVVNSHYMENAMKMMAMTDPANSQQAAIMQQVSYLQSKYYNIFILLQLPFMSLATFWLYRRHRLNYAEHLTLNTFITAQTTFIGMVLMLFLFITGHQNFNVIRFFTVTIGLVSVSYHIVMYMQFFQQLNLKGFFKALLTYVVGLVIFFLSTVILSFLAGLIFMLIKKALH
jgi:nucleoside diphosphate kinase